MIADTKKWAAKTGATITHICEETDRLCIGFGLAYVDPFAPEDEKYSFVIKLAYDPHNPPEEEEREKIRKALEIAVNAIAGLFEGEVHPFERDPSSIN